jgi:hypothetical protein
LGWLGGLPRFGFPFSGRPVPRAFFGRPRFPFNLKKVEKELLLLIRLTNIAIWSFYILGRGDSSLVETGGR